MRIQTATYHAISVTVNRESYLENSRIICPKGPAYEFLLVGGSAENLFRIGPDDPQKNATNKSM